MTADVLRQGVALIGSFVLGLGVLGAACGGADDTPSGSTATATASTTVAAAPSTEAPTTTAAPTTTGTPITTDATPEAMTLVNVYWGSTVLNPAAGAPERIGAGARDVAADTPVHNSLEALFAGVNSVEQTVGMSTSIPTDTQVLGISVDEATATATVDLSAEFAAPSGSFDETMRLAQVVFTVTQFDGLDRVKFHIDGVAQDPLLSHGFVVGDGLSRDDFETVRPSILIEQPYPDAEVTNPLVIRGESNTFEATVRYAITAGGGDGVLLTEGFTTATGGMGVWGGFEVTVDLAAVTSEYQSGAGSVIMWEDSPRDGTRVNVVEVPIVLPER